MTVMATGMLSLIGLPYLYRTLWGPFLDRFALTALGKRRSWILLTQILLIAGFNVMAWFSPATSPVILAILAVFIACCSATQDMAIEAHRTEILRIEEQGLGASMAVLGYRIALLVSGGLALVLAQHLGFEDTYRIMGILMLVGVIITLYSPEPSIHLEKPISLTSSYVEPLKDLLNRQNIVPLLLLVIFFKFGEAFTTTTSGIVMPFLIQGLGFSIEIVGYINKIVGMSAVVMGGLVAGFLLTRWSLFKALLFFGLLQAATNILFVVLAIVGKNLSLFCLAIFFDNLAAGMGSTAIVALLMRTVNKQFTATQFSLLASFSTLPRVLSGPIAASIQQVVGWVGLYQCSVIFALIFIPFLILLRDKTKDPFSISEIATPL